MLKWLLGDLLGEVVEVEAWEEVAEVVVEGMEDLEGVVEAVGEAVEGLGAAEVGVEVEAWGEEAEEVVEV